MKTELLYLFTGGTLLCSAGFVFVAIIWLRKMRETVSGALAEAAGQQIRTSQRLNEAIAQVQKQQDSYNQQIHILAQAGMRLQQELSSVANRLDSSHSETARGPQTLH
jgi:chromosome segregation ATPase